MVKGDADGAGGTHVRVAIPGVGPHHGRGLDAKGPYIVLGQDAAGGVGQSGRDASQIVPTGSEWLGGLKDVNRGVEPFARALDRRPVADTNQGQWLRQTLAGRVADGRQWHHRPVEHHREGSVARYVGRVWCGDDLADLQKADGREIKRDFAL